MVGVLEALPEPPRNLFTAGDPTIALTRTAGHEATYSTVLAANDRFWAVQRGVELVRGTAGHGNEHLPDGAPPLAYAYRNWRVAMEKANGELRSVQKHFRLWFTIVDGWQPGVWRPAELESSAADRSFSAKLRRFGGAVGIPVGLSGLTRGPVGRCLPLGDRGSTARPVLRG